MIRHQKRLSRSLAACPMGMRMEGNHPGEKKKIYDTDW